MPLYRARIVWTQDSGAYFDRVVWSWGLDAAAAPAATDLVGAIGVSLTFGAAGKQLGPRLANGLQGLVVEIYPAAGGAAVDAAPATNLTGSGSLSRLPSQISLAVTAQISTSRGVRPKGRTYLGPFQTTANAGGGRPTQDTIDAGLNFSAELHRRLVALGATPAVLSADGTVSRGAIVGYSVDNTWDVQRRRAYERTAVTAQTP